MIIIIYINIYIYIYKRHNQQENQIIKSTIYNEYKEQDRPED